MSLPRLAGRRRANGRRAIIDDHFSAMKSAFGQMYREKAGHIIICWSRSITLIVDVAGAITRHYRFPSVTATAAVSTYAYLMDVRWPS